MASTYTIASRVVSWIVPPGITRVRARVWGGGGGATTADSGGGGGFAMKTVTVAPGDSITVTIGMGGPTSTGGQGSTSSFGGYVSATGGRNLAGTGGIAGAGSSGDINMNGSGTMTSEQMGGTAGNLFIAFTGTSADGIQQTVSSIPVLTLMGTPANPLDKIGTGYLFGVPSRAFVGYHQNAVATDPNPDTTYFGNGAGGNASVSPEKSGTYPGGGASYSARGAAGLVIVEY